MRDTDEQCQTYYQLGREARIRNFGVKACNIPATRAVRRAWWLAGWHDEDMEIFAMTGRTFKSEAA